jgi:phytoene/squalene synthetase
MTNKKQYYDNLISRDGGELGVSNLDEAYAFCKKLAKSHYENFPVGSMLVPRAVRKYFYSIYAYSRIADDLGDEYPDTLERRLEIINQFETLLEIKYKNGEKANPIFLALHDTIKQKNIPLTPFKNLLEAFRKDCRFTPYQTKN